MRTRAWPILAVSSLTVLVLSLGALYAGPSLMAMCNGSLTGISTESAASLCGGMIEAARVGVLAGAFLLMGAVAFGILSVAGRRGRRSRDSRPLVSVHARRR